MPRKRSKSSGVGFSPEVRKVDTSKGYVTLFDRVTSATKGEQKSFSWYKNTVKSLTSEFKQEPGKLIENEKKDRNDDEDFQDENVLRNRVVPGHLYFFEYEAKMKWLPYYDRFPLVYVLKIVGDAFYGANLHYITPKKRVKVINKLKHGAIDIPKSVIHKYIIGHARSLYLDLSSQEWETAILLPIEDFVTTKGTGKMSYDRELVWAETDEKYQDRLKGQRIIKGYGSKESKEMVT